MKEYLEAAIKALETEIETVKKKPSKEWLKQGKITQVLAEKEWYVEFDHPIHNLRFVEECKAYVGSKTLKVIPVDINEQTMVLKFDTKPDNNFDELELEWENDFVLKKTKERLEVLLEAQSTYLLQGLLKPDSVNNENSFEYEIYDDGLRNQAQYESIEKALNKPVSFIWGPPGTGKTSTLGFVVTNYLLHGKKVLFASNTNRAVDVGVKSILEALEVLHIKQDRYKLTRFGDLALVEEELESVWFTKLMEGKKEDLQQKLAYTAELLDRLKSLENQAETLLSSGDSVPDALETQLIFLQDEVQRRGGLDYLELKLSTGATVNERNELARFQCVATTLAKVCTSDLLDDFLFDVVIVDEASMANLPYLFVLASKAIQHMVLVGDPMQLPPISVSEQAEARDFLEKDIFTFLSGADSPDALFKWHDSYPEFTSFFDTQYRLNADLAELISTTFYEGRLKTAALKIENATSVNHSYTVVNTEAYKPEIKKKDGEGFKPVNTTHISVVADLIEHELIHSTVATEIGIIVPFRSVVWDYRKQLRTLGLSDIEVGTIHTFQGREKSVIIFDTVMSSDSGRHYSVRPFDEIKSGLQVPRLLNVAFSRSKHQFYVIADMSHINRVYRHKFLGKLLNKMLEA